MLLGGSLLLVAMRTSERRSSGRLFEYVGVLVHEANSYIQGLWCVLCELNDNPWFVVMRRQQVYGSCSLLLPHERNSSLPQPGLSSVSHPNCSRSLA